MNLFSSDAIKSRIEITTVLYRMQKSSHSESLELHYIDHSQDGKEKVYYFNKKAPISTIWMQVLDLNMPDDPKIADTILKLHQSAELEAGWHPRNCQRKYKSGILHAGT